MADFVAQEIKLFGASVSSISISSGLNTQSTTAQLTIVFEDDGPLASEDLEQNFPPLGTCIGLKIGELEFAGMLQRYTQKIDISGYAWNVVLESPTKVLDGVQVILDQFMGDTFPGLALFNNPSIRNLWNAFGYRENYNSAGGGIFGGSNRNSVGFPAIDLLQIMQYFATDESFFGRKPKFGETEYELDLTNILQRLSSFQEVRIQGDSQSALNIISEVCSLCLCDFIVGIKPKDGVYPNGVISNPVIYFKLIDRSIPPDSGMIKRMVKEYERQGVLVSADTGKELNDTITQRVVIGGPATRYVEVPFGKYKQVWGKTHDPEPQYVPYIVLEDGRPYFLSNIAPLLELRAAGHSFDSWLLFQVITKFLSDSYDDLDPDFQNMIKAQIRALQQSENIKADKDNRMPSKITQADIDVDNLASDVFINPILRPLLKYVFTDVVINKFNMARILNGTAKPADLLNTALDATAYGGQGQRIQYEIEKIYNSVKNAYDEYYGVKFAAYLPLEEGGLPNNRKFVREGQHYVTTWDIADSAWNSKFPYPEITLYDETGKMKAIGEWPYLPLLNDYTSFGDSYYVAPDIIATPITPQKDIYFVSDTEAYCIVDTPSVLVYDKYATESNGLFWMLHLMLGAPLDKLEALYGFGFDAVNSTYGIAPAKFYPKYIGIPQVSNRYNWGPWYSSLADNGRAEVIFDSTLAPETFGGIDKMNSVGNYYATVVNANITGMDSGFIELAEYPSGSVGDRFLVSGPYVTSIDVSMSTSGYKTTYKFNTWTPEFGKLSKQNIDRLATNHKNIMKVKNETSSRIRKRPLNKLDFKDRNARNVFRLFPPNGLAAELDANGRITMGNLIPSRQRGRAKRNNDQ